MKATKIHETLLSNIPLVINGIELKETDRELIALIQIENVLLLFKSKKKSKKAFKKIMLNSGFHFKTKKISIN